MSHQNNIWTVLTILNTTSDYFKNHAIENPRLNAERLLAHVLKLDRLQLYLKFDRILDKKELADYRGLVRRRANHEPLQYLTGETEFMGMPFMVDASVLIPRPETEILVEAVLALREKFTGKSPVVWEIGTGSGCVAVSLARMWPGLRVIASDISEQALAVAQENACLNKIQESITFLAHDIFKNQPVAKGDIDIIVSNPPYISQGEVGGLAKEVRDYEPIIALTDEGDGMAFYRRIFELIGLYSGCKYVLLELSGTQPDAVRSLLNEVAHKNIYTLKDLNGHERVLKLEL